MGDVPNSSGSFIDSPVFSIIDYFNSMFHSYLNVAIRLGILLALCGLLWNCFQVVFGLQENRKLIVGTVSKWMMFIVILVFYPSVTKGLRVFAIDMATSVSGTSIDTLTNGLVNYLNVLEDMVKIKDEEDTEKRYKELIDAKQKFLDEWNEKHWLDYEWTADDAMYSDSEYAKIQNELQSLEKEHQRIEAQKILKEKGKGKFRTINAIKSVLIIDGKDTTESYKLNLSLKDTKGNDTGYLSPNAMIRISVLAAYIMWEAMWFDDIMISWEENANKGIIKKKQITDFPFSRIFDLVLCFFCEILIVVISAIELIQYIMCIIEFIICVTFGIVLVPCMLFDGLKDMSMKLIPTLLAQAVKLSMITMCMFFCFYTYLQMAQNIIGDSDGFSLWHFTYVIFTCLLTFALCSNAPKLASALLTGQPQMSMGEFVQSAAAIAGGTAATVAATRGAIGAGSRFTANRLGDAAAMVGGGIAGKLNAARDGKNQLKGAIGGAGSALAQRAGNRIKGAMQSAANYKGGNPLSRFTGGRGGGGMSGSSGGSNRFTSNNPQQEAAWKNKQEEQGKNQHSMNYGDHVTANGTKSTLSEYLQDQFNQGYSPKYRNYGEHKPYESHPDSFEKNNFNPPTIFSGGGGISPISPNGGMPVANGNYSSSYTPRLEDKSDAWLNNLKSAGESSI